MPPRKFIPSTNQFCVRCRMDRQAHKEGAPGSCSQFANVLPKRHRGGKPKHVPTGIERAFEENK